MNDNQLLQQILKQTHIISDDITYIKTDISEIKGRQDRMENDICEIKGCQEKMEQRLENVELSQKSMEKDIKDLKDTQRDEIFPYIQMVASELGKRCDSLESKMDSIVYCQENEIIPYIKIIAEGHLDLNRKLDEAIEAKAEREKDRIRLGVAEHDIRRVKERLQMA